MERAGESNPFKQKLAEQLFQISFFQRLLLKMLEQNSNRSETAAIIRILLLSAYLLTQIGFHSSIPLEDLIDLSISYIKAQQNEIDLLPDLLRLLQTLLMVLTRNGELLLNCDLFPYLVLFLSRSEVVERVEKGDERILSWYVVCATYLSFNSENNLFCTVSPFRDRLLSALNSDTHLPIPLGCNCVRALFARQWFIGFGPYPVSAFRCINKHNDYRNITPTSIKMFPLSLIGNLTGLYLMDDNLRSGLLIGGTSLMARQRYLSLKRHQQGKIDLNYSSNEAIRGVVGSVTETQVYGSHSPNKRENDAGPSRGRDELRREARRKALKSVSRMEFINGIEKTYYDTFVGDSDTLINHVHSDVHVRPSILLSQN